MPSDGRWSERHSSERAGPTAVYSVGMRLFGFLNVSRLDNGPQLGPNFTGSALVHFAGTSAGGQGCALIDAK